jgi:hypothetical protein
MGYIIFVYYTINMIFFTASLEVKRPDREADHSPPSSAEIMNAWSYTCTRQYAFIAWCLVKHRENFTFYLFFTFTQLIWGQKRQLQKDMFEFLYGVVSHFALGL